jgi:hypothetical protein
MPKGLSEVTNRRRAELFNGKGLKAKHMIFVGLFHSNAG